MVNYAVRVSRSSVDLRGVFDKLGKCCAQVIVYEHPDEGNVHCHLLLMDCTVSTDTLKNYIKSTVGNVSRTDWSFKSGADLCFVSYMSKGKYDPAFVSGIEAAVVAEYKAKGYDKGAILLVKGKLVRPTSEPKKTKRELTELMISRLEPHASVDVLMKMVRKVLIENNEVLGNFKVMDYVDAVMMRGDKTRWLDNMIYLYNRRYAK